MKRIELTIEDINEHGIGAVSLVESPATEEDFVKLSKAKVMLALAEDRRVVTGPILIPDKEIYRDASFVEGECMIFFSAETILQASKLFLRSDDIQNATINHAYPTKSAKLIESWIVENDEIDKSVALGLNVPKGTWMGSYEILDDDLWKAIKGGAINGFSIEANFNCEDAGESDVELSKSEAEQLVDFARRVLNKNK